MMFTTAIEGGINYWASVQSYHWIKPEFHDHRGHIAGCEDIDGFKAEINPPGEDGEWGVFDTDKDTQTLTIDLAVMERGALLFRRYCQGEIDGQGQPVAIEDWKPLRDDHYWRQWLVQEATNGKEGDSDAEVADQIVQWGLFGKGIYG
jgi:hypothetical protein